MAKDKKCKKCGKSHHSHSDRLGAIIAQTTENMIVKNNEDISFSVGMVDPHGSFKANDDGTKFTCLLEGLYRFDIIGMIQSSGNTCVQIKGASSEVMDFATCNVDDNVQIVTALPLKKNQSVSIRIGPGDVYIHSGLRLIISRVG